MIWQLICVDRVLHKHELLDALSELFGVQKHAIFLFKELPEILEIPKAGPANTIRIMCQTFLARNVEFPLIIEIYLNDLSLIPQNDIVLLSNFCNLLQCRGIIDDKSVNPFTWLLLDSNSNVRTISVDNIEEYDEAETYAIN